MATLETLIQQMREAIAEDDFELYSTSATEFRETILDIAASPRLKELSNSLLLISSRVVLRKIMIPLRQGISFIICKRNFIPCLTI